MPVDKAWDRIEAWLSDYAPDVLPSLESPAGHTAIADLENVMGLTLPAGFKASLARHDGQSDPAPSGLFPYSTFLGPSPAWRLLSLEEIAREWTMMAELTDGGDFATNKTNPAPGISSNWWNPGWIPIADDGGGDYVCIDARPAAKGVAGQIILFHHDDGDRKVLASSFEAWLTQLAENMEAGLYYYDPEDWGLMEKES